MPAVGGSIEEIGIAGRIFAVAADADSNRKLGGFENDVQANGNGTARIIKTRVPLSLDGISVEIDDDRGDQEFLQGVADLNDFSDIDITYASGATYQGTGILTGDFQTSSQNATAPIVIMGPGKLTKQ